MHDDLSGGTKSTRLVQRVSSAATTDHLENPNDDEREAYYNRAQEEARGEAFDLMFQHAAQMAADAIGPASWTNIADQKHS